MYPTLPFGPLSVPTGPMLAILAVVFGLDIASRYGKRLGMHPDDIWNTGMIALAAGLIVARLWNVFQFWRIYLDEPILIFSIRPSGFEFWPGVAAALIGGYLYLLRRSLDPVRVGAALFLGTLFAGSVLAISGFLTGNLLGMPSNLPWALAYFGEPRHPAGLYQAAGMLGLCLFLWFASDSKRPGRTILLAALGYCILRLFTDGFVDNTVLVGPYRVSQIVALTLALIFALALARLERRNASQTT